MGKGKVVDKAPLLATYTELLHVILALLFALAADFDKIEKFAPTLWFLLDFAASVAFLPAIHEVFTEDAHKKELLSRNLLSKLQDLCCAYVKDSIHYQQKATAVEQNCMMSDAFNRAVKAITWLSSKMRGLYNSELNEWSLATLTISQKPTVYARGHQVS